MKKYDSDEICKTSINGKTYCFRYSNPDTHDGGKHFSGSAQVWEEGTDKTFTVFASVRSENIDSYYSKIVEAIEKEISK